MQSLESIITTKSTTWIPGFNENAADIELTLQYWPSLQAAPNSPSPAGLMYVAKVFGLVLCGKLQPNLCRSGVTETNPITHDNC